MVMVFNIYVSNHDIKSISLGNAIQKKAKVWGKARVDYTAANEYAESHYGLKNYFQVGDNGTGIVNEDIFNARDGVMMRRNDCGDSDDIWINTPKLSHFGFELLQGFKPPMNLNDWNNPSQVSEKYVRYLRHSVIPKLFDSTGIESIVFYNANLRGEGLPFSTRNGELGLVKTAPVAATVHIDFDVGACTNATELVNLLLSERIIVPEDCNEFGDEGRRRIIQLIESGHRFVLLNFWNSLTSRPTSRAPLGVLATDYDQECCSFPEAKPSDHSRWYCYPQLGVNECLVFKQYDRSLSFSSDVWHTGLSDIGHYTNDPPRRNFDVRAFIVLNERIDKSIDRFGEKRRKSFMNMHESECFCENQADSRANGKLLDK